MRGVKIFVLVLGLMGLLGAAGASAGQELREGNFDIRFEPTARLQTGAQIPFQIKVVDALGKPLVDAKVTLQIETASHERATTFKAPAVAPGMYVAKPVFPSTGQWSVFVHVLRADQESARTIVYSIPD
jgi:YtkA-like